MLRHELLIIFQVKLMAASKISALLQRVNRTLKRETQYTFEGPFDTKEYQTAMITGHRWFKYDIKVDKLITMALNQGVTKFLCGMALGTDQVAAEILVRRKLKWTAVIPCADQHKL
jgi:hypothetical protein